MRQLEQSLAPLLRHARRPQQLARLHRQQVAQRHHPQQLPPPRVAPPPPARRTRPATTTRPGPQPGQKLLAQPILQARRLLERVKQQHPSPARSHHRHCRRASATPIAPATAARNPAATARPRSGRPATGTPPPPPLRNAASSAVLPTPPGPCTNNTLYGAASLHRRPKQLQLPARPTNQRRRARRSRAPNVGGGPTSCGCLESTNLPRRESKFSRPRRQPPPSRQHARTTERRPRPFQPRTRSRRSPPRVRRLPSA